MRACVRGFGDACGLPPPTNFSHPTLPFPRPPDPVRLTRVCVCMARSSPSYRYNPKVRPMMLTLEKIQYVHRPLAYYAMLTGLQVRAFTLGVVNLCCLFFGGMWRGLVCVCV